MDKDKDKIEDDNKIEEKFYTQADMDAKEKELEKARTEAKTYKESNDRLHNTIQTMSINKEPKEERTIDKIVEDTFGGKRK